MDFATDVIGIGLVPWQRWLLIHALELLGDGRFRYRTVVILVARQNGKTTIVEVKNLWKMFVLRIPLVIGTAQNLDIAEESWDKAVEIAEGVPELAAEVRHVDRTNGKKALRLAHGSRWKIAATSGSRKGGRGLSGDDVNLDELREHHNWDSWAAVSKTTLARRNYQIYAFSNAGDDRSVVLNELQRKGRAAAANPATADPGIGHFEWSAPEEVRCTCGRPDETHTAACRLQDRRAWAQANPSLGYTVTEEAIASALSTDPEAIFRTECLCQRVETLAGQWQILGEAEWNTAAEPDSAPLDPVAFAAAVTWDRKFGAIAVAGRRADGKRHVEVIDHRAGTGWMPDRLAGLAKRWDSCAVVVDRGGPAGSLIPALEALGVEVLEPTMRDAAAAYASFYDAVAGPDLEARDLRHRDQPALRVALAGATSRPLGDGLFLDRKNATVDTSPLEAVMFAGWGHATNAHLEDVLVLDGDLMA